MPKNTHQSPSSTLRKLRLEAGLSQRALAECAAVAPTSIRLAEGGSIPTPPTQHRIAIALSTALDREVTFLDLWPLQERAA